MDRDELILQKLSELAEDVKDLRKNVGGLQKDITDVKLQQRTIGSGRKLRI